MYIVLSPAKSLNLDPWEPVIAPTQPALLEDAARLARTCRNLPQKRLRELMSISRDLAKLNADRFAAWQPEHTPLNSKPAAWTFAGDTYRGLQAETFDADELTWAQDHVGLLSGLYGLLRPMDLIQPYRLEMGTSLKTRRGTSLYDWWRDAPTKLVNARTEGHADRTLVIAASKEYASVLRRKQLEGPVLTVEFREYRGGEAKMISFFAKQGRGAIARWAVRNRVERADDLRAFDYDGYAFDEQLSKPGVFVFSRDGEA
jgi:cytoplasmic iron level regulating protein YaaA (DUF328/UPF0246 family)